MLMQVEGLGFGYDPSRPVLRDVTLSYDSADVMCVLGSNGVGKSTLLRCIMGELHPQAGRILIDGKTPGELGPAGMARRVAYIAQVHAPSFSYRVLDVATMGRTSRLGPFSGPGRADEEIAREQLEYLGIDHLAERPYTEVSGGERQLVMIAAALAQQPQALLLDEPTAHLDFGNQFKFLQLVERLRGRGMGVLMTTHFPDHALLLGCTTAILTRDGVASAGPAEDVVTEESLRDIYGVDVHVRRVGRRTVCIPGDMRDPLGRAGS